MKIIIKRGRNDDDELLAALEKIEDCSIVGYTNKDSKLHNIKIKEYNIFSTFEAVNMYKKNQVDAFVLSYKIKYNLLKNMICEFIELGVNITDIFIATPEFYEEPKESHLCLWMEYKCLPYIEYHVVDHCNLNCKGCVHFSPLVKGEVFADYKRIESDLRELKRLVKYIERIHILGGEPLLNKELANYILLTKEIYPYAEIVIVTNGLLVCKMTEELIEVIKNNKVSLSISLYKPMYEKMSEIAEFLFKNKITYIYTGPVSEFSYTFSKDEGMAKGVKSLNCHCPNLYNGRLFICPIIAYIKYYNEAFGESIDTNAGGIDIYDLNMTWERIVEFLSIPVEVCDKCLYISKEKQHTFEWQRMKEKNIQDYIWEKEIDG